MGTDIEDSTLGGDGPPNYGEIRQRLRAGTIIPFFGAGASISCGFPSGVKLADRLATKAKFPGTEGRENLALVASYFIQRPDFDSLNLHQELRLALTVEAEPGPLHRCLASSLFEQTRFFVTTNYDDLVEKALAKRSPWVVVDRGTSGNVWCKSPEGEWSEIEAKNLGREIKDRTRPIVLKLHGSLDPVDHNNDSFLITEEHYVDFLGRAEGAQLPQMLSTLMRSKSFLFLGYGLKDWNVRVLLHKLNQTRQRPSKIRSWAIVRNPGPAEKELWEAQQVRMHDIDLAKFASGLEAPA